MLRPDNLVNIPEKVDLVEYYIEDFNSIDVVFYRDYKGELYIEGAQLLNILKLDSNSLELAFKLEDNIKTMKGKYKEDLILNDRNSLVSTIYYTLEGASILIDKLDNKYKYVVDKFLKSVEKQFSILDEKISIGNIVFVLEADIREECNRNKYEDKIEQLKDYVEDLRKELIETHLKDIEIKNYLDDMF